eukprot:jgi/Botrbrau1/19055/Bobra.0100s0079.1
MQSRTLGCRIRGPQVCSGHLRPNVPRPLDMHWVSNRSRLPGRRKRDVSKGSILLPDITPSAATPELEKQMKEAAYEIVRNFTVGDICLRAGVEIVATIALAIFSNAVMKWITDLAKKNAQKYTWLSRKEKEDDPVATAVKEKHNILRVIRDTAVASLRDPIRRILPVVAGLYSIRTALLAAEILLERSAMATSRFKIARHMASETTRMVSLVEDRILGASKVLAVFFGVWFLLSWNNQLLQVLVAQDQARKTTSQDLTIFQRLLVPLSNLFSWAIVVLGALWTAGYVGIDIRPLLALGGISGLAIGFGAQQLTSNVMSALSMFFTNVFVVGERVTLMGPGGGEVATGIVERIDPMRTLLRSDEGLPVALPNSAVMNYIVVNRSRLQPVKQIFKVSGQYSTRLAVQCPDWHVLPGLCTDLEAMLKGLPGVDPALPLHARVVSYEGSKAIVHLLATTAPPEEDTDFSENTALVLVAAGDVLEKRGLALA